MALHSFLCIYHKQDRSCNIAMQKKKRAENVSADIDGHFKNPLAMGNRHTAWWKYALEARANLSPYTLCLPLWLRISLFLLSHSFVHWLLNALCYCTACSVYFCSVHWDPNRLERLYRCLPVVYINAVQQAICPAVDAFTKVFPFMSHLCACLHRFVTLHRSLSQSLPLYMKYLAACVFVCR